MQKSLEIIEQTIFTSVTYAAIVLVHRGTLITVEVVEPSSLQSMNHTLSALAAAWTVQIDAYSSCTQPQSLSLQVYFSMNAVFKMLYIFLYLYHPGW